MPKRVIDFDAMWGSDKIASCADWAQAEYAWLYGLADASGCFEITNLRVVWGRVAAIRRNLTIERLEQVFAEFQDRGLLFVWEHEGKRYAHWTGSDVPGRLPPPSWRMRLERLAPPVPKQKLAEYMARFSRGRAALAGAGFRGEERCDAPPQKNLQSEISDLRREQRPEEDLKSEISDLRGNQQAQLNSQSEISDLREERQIARSGQPSPMGRRGESAEACRGGRRSEPGLEGVHALTGRLEEAQGQDLNWGLDLNRDLAREEELLRRGARGNSETSHPPAQGQLWDAESNPSYSSETQPAARGRSSPAGASVPPQKNSRAAAGHTSAVAAPPKALPDFDPRGMSAKEIALQKELRVGQGPVCWPGGVSKEVLERDRLRQLARAKSL